MTHDAFQTLEPCFRWYGPTDRVPLPYIRQAGARGIFTSLHHVPYGEVWTDRDIQTVQQQLESHGLTWRVVESLPIHDDIKLGQDNFDQHIEHYLESLRALARCGVQIVVYNFMPGLDWVRTDMAYEQVDGSNVLRFSPVQFCAFERFALQRDGAEQDYIQEQWAQAEVFWQSLNREEQDQFVSAILEAFPGGEVTMTLDGLRELLGRFAGIDAQVLRDNLHRFLQAVVPTAESLGMRLAIHPDDPPRPLLGLPRVVSTEEDLAGLLDAVDSPANGLCFCTGSLGANASLDLPAMAERFASRIHAVHLRNVQHEADGSFHESGHLSGDVPMTRVIDVLLKEQERRREAGREDWRLPMRPDHGPTLMDDLQKAPPRDPGYACLGRAMGVSVLQGMQLGLLASRR